MASLEEKICEKHKIDHLTENQKLSISSIQEGKDVFIGTKTGSGKSLSYEVIPIILGENAVTLIVAPLLGIMKEQVDSLSKLGYRATFLEPTTSVEMVASGFYNFVFGSPEILVGDPKWRDVIRSSEFGTRLRLIVVDEAHTIVHWGESSGSEDAFREWFSHIGELRSLCVKVPILALTATACPKHRRRIMTKLCFGRNACVITDSPDRKNIKINVLKIKNNDDFKDIFAWIFKGLSDGSKSFPRHLIFCNSIKDCASLYMSFLQCFGKSIVFDMYHSKTTECVKEKIRTDMKDEKGDIRILICTNAAGMGVNFSGVHNVVHFGPPREIDTYVQQMGRAGRDGIQSQDIIIYKPAHLKVLDEDVKKLVTTDQCRRSVLTNSYMCSENTEIKKHLCCDLCEKNCSCGEDTCPYAHPAKISFVTDSIAHDNSSSETSSTEDASDLSDNEFD